MIEWLHMVGVRCLIRGRYFRNNSEESTAEELPRLKQRETTSIALVGYASTFGRKSSTMLAFA